MSVQRRGAQPSTGPVWPTTRITSWEHGALWAVIAPLCQPSSVSSWPCSRELVVCTLIPDFLICKTAILCKDSIENTKTEYLKLPLWMPLIVFSLSSYMNQKTSVTPIARDPGVGEASVSLNSLTVGGGTTNTPNNTQGRRKVREQCPGVGKYVRCEGKGRTREHLSVSTHDLAHHIARGKAFPLNGQQRSAALVKTRKCQVEILWKCIHLE